MVILHVVCSSKPAKREHDTWIHLLLPLAGLSSVANVLLFSCVLCTMQIQRIYSELIKSVSYDSLTNNAPGKVSSLLGSCCGGCEAGFAALRGIKIMFSHLEVPAFTAKRVTHTGDFHNGH